MTSFSSTLNRAFHGAFDTALRVDSSQALNLGREPRVAGGRDIASEIRAALANMTTAAVDTNLGALDYDRLRQSDIYERFRKCTTALTGFDPSRLASREERLAFWINLYNALVIDAVITFRTDRSVREDNGFFRRAAYVIGNRRYSADDIEHGILRGNRKHPLPVIPFPQFTADDPRLVYSLNPIDPRIHFALNCASLSCPPVAVYEATTIDQQLDLAASSFINGGSVAFAPGQGKVLLSKIFRWYERDFGRRRAVLDFILRYLDNGELRTALAGRTTPPIAYQPYDWSLNRV
ncbi:MAG: DUF547 domain-containing protein [Dehalococcoidia bacterium]